MRREALFTAACSQCLAEVELEPLINLGDLSMFWMSCAPCEITGLVQIQLTSGAR